VRGLYRRAKVASPVAITQCAVALLALAIAGSFAYPRSAAAAFHGRNGLIAFVVSNNDPENGNDAVFTVKPGGGHVHQTRASCEDQTTDNLSFSPSGQYLIYSCERLGTDLNVIEELDTRSGKLRMISDASSATWAPDGHHLLLGDLHSEQNGIWVANSNGKHPRRISRLEPVLMAWSSRNLIAVATQSAVWTMDPDGHHLHRLPIKVTSSLDWRADGRRLLFATGTGQIVSTHADGTHRQVLTRGHHDTDPAFSPDGKSIVFVRGRYTWIMDSSGAGKHRLIADDPVDADGVGDLYATQPVWQPRP